jgi:hypothetical protein
MTFDELLILVSESSEPLAQELLASLGTGEVQPLLPGPGRESARSLGATFALRAVTSARAGIGTAGLDGVLRRLNEIPPETPILLFHFLGKRLVFSVFVDEEHLEIVGIILVSRSEESL